MWQKSVFNSIDLQAMGIFVTGMAHDFCWWGKSMKPRLQPLIKTEGDHACNSPKNLMLENKFLSDHWLMFNTKYLTT